jgi:hypothetical protein
MKLYIDCIIILFIFNTIIYSEMCKFSYVDYDMYKTNPEYFNQNYSTSYNICKIKEFVTIILYKFVFCLVFLVLLYI